MQNVVIDKPYEFVSPCRGRLWPSILGVYLRRHLRTHYGVEKVVCRGQEHLVDSLKAGHAVMLTPNHCRDGDPLVLGYLSSAVGQPFYVMASWHLFMQSRLQRFLLRRAGAFSIYREGMDKSAIDTATQILETAERPLVIFPEGVISRTNDRLNDLMEGAALIARAAAKRRARQSPAGRVVVHPVAIRYRFEGNIDTALRPTLDEIEARLSWRAHRELTTIDRIYKIGYGLLCLKEIEFFGQVQSGSIAQRLEGLIDRLLVPLEQEYLGGQRERGVVARVKKLRMKILPEMIAGQIDEAEQQRRWTQLADVYLAQQLSNYPPEYIAADPTPERLLETVERFEEDLTDVARAYRPIWAEVCVAEAIDVAPMRDRGEAGDSLMIRIEEQLRRMLGIEGASARAESSTATIAGNRRN